MPKKPTKKAPAKRMGRPPKPASERRGVTLNLRVTETEKARLEAAAAAEGVSMTALIVAAVDERVTKSR